MKINRIIKKIKFKFKRRINIGGVIIELPKGHDLYLYQSIYPLYDRFLPVLAKQLNHEGVIIDIGANVGDTLAAIKEVSDCSVSCIEGSDYFYNYLMSNIKNFPNQVQSKIKCIKTFVGTGNIKGNLVIIGGRTATIKEEESNSIKYETLDNLFLNEEKISLIKSDTDGFDWDVLLSAEKVLAKHKPMLFWENEVYNSDQEKGYERLYTLLSNNGYNSIYVFDNFGNIMFESTDFKSLKSMNKYLLSMNLKKSERTLFYTDILAVTDDKIDIANAAISEFKKKYGLIS